MCGGGTPVLNLIYEKKTTFCLQPFKMGFSVKSLTSISELGESVVSTNNVIIPL